jgi:S1-C subfamily serine protease
VILVKMGDRAVLKLLSLILLAAGVVAAQSAPPPKDNPAIAKAAHNNPGQAPTKINDAFAKDELVALQAIEIEKEDPTLVTRPDGSIVTRSEAAVDVAKAEAVSSQEKLISILVENIYQDKFISDYPLEVLEKSPTLAKDVKGFSSRISTCISAEKDGPRRRSAELPKVCSDEVISPPETKEELAALRRKINAEVRSAEQGTATVVANDLERQPLPKSAPIRKDIPAIAKSANGAIVTVITATDDKPIAQGTGFLVSADGVIVTNYHVIKEGNVAIVKFPDGTVLPVDGVPAADKVRDLAIIKIHGKTFRTLTLGNSDQVQVGEEVVAIGNPLGLELTVSNGIVSGLRTDESGKFLQTTAPISPGSSGGPLFNMLSEVVGINTMYLEGGENLNFAIPINDAKRLLQPNFSKVHDLPNEAEPQTSEGYSSTSVVAQTPIRDSTGEYGGIVHNKTASSSAEFWIVVNDVRGVLTGCMGVRQPLFGSGPLSGRVDGADVSFVVTSAIGKITFVGQRNNGDINGSYTVVRDGSPDQLGNFTLNKAKNDGLPMVGKQSQIGGEEMIRTLHSITLPAIIAEGLSQFSTQSTIQLSEVI